MKRSILGARIVVLAASLLIIGARRSAAASLEELLKESGGTLVEDAGSLPAAPSTPASSPAEIVQILVPAPRYFLTVSGGDHHESRYEQGLVREFGTRFERYMFKTADDANGALKIVTCGIAEGSRSKLSAALPEVAPGIHGVCAATPLVSGLTPAQYEGMTKAMWEDSRRFWPFLAHTAEDGCLIGGGGGVVVGFFVGAFASANPVGGVIGGAFGGSLGAIVGCVGGVAVPLAARAVDGERRARGLADPARNLTDASADHEIHTLAPMGVGEGAGMIEKYAARAQGAAR